MRAIFRVGYAEKLNSRFDFLWDFFGDFLEELGFSGLDSDLDVSGGIDGGGGDDDCGEGCAGVDVDTSGLDRSDVVIEV